SRCLGFGPGDLLEGARQVWPIPRQNRGGIGKLAAEDSGDQPRKSGTALLWTTATRCTLGTRADSRHRGVLASVGWGTDCEAEFSQPRGCPARAGRSPGRGAGAVAGGLPRSTHLAPPGGAAIPGGGPPHGSNDGQCGKTVDPGPGAFAP